MNENSKSCNFGRTGLMLILILPLLLAGCPQPPDEPPEEAPPVEMPAPPPPPEPLVMPEGSCPPECGLVVGLPEDPTAAPTVSRSELHSRPGEQVQITLVDHGDRPGQAATVLRFERGQEAFVNPGGGLMRTVPLNNAGTHPFRLREDLRCPDDEPDCSFEFKYDVVNSGNPDREVLDPHVIIWPY